MTDVEREIIREIYEEEREEGYAEGYAEGRAKERSRFVGLLLATFSADSLLNDPRFSRLGVTQSEIDAITATNCNGN